MLVDPPACVLLFGKTSHLVDELARILTERGWRIRNTNSVYHLADAIRTTDIDLAIVDGSVADTVRANLVEAGIPTLALGGQHQSWAEVCSPTLPAAMEALERAIEMENADLATRHEALQKQHAHLLALSARERCEHEEQLASLRAELLTQSGHAKSAFLANMSHELRTPLNAILGYSELLEEEVRDLGADELVTDLKKIHESGHALLNLINDILDLARIEAGRAEVYPQIIDVRELCTEVLREVSARAAAHQNTLDVDLGPMVTTLFSDQRKTKQCLRNLLDNACKFTDDGHVMLRVSADPSPGARRVVFEVEDDGIGLSAQQQVEIFREFVRSDEPGRPSGSGLGLSITQRLTGLLGGRLGVESELGKGSVFRLEIPDKLDAEVTEDPDWVSDHESQLLGERMPPTVLVIDPDETTRAQLGRILTAEGYQVLEARSGAEGVAFAERFAPHVICLDSGAQDVDGWSTLKAIKSKPATAQIPVVMITRLDDRSRGIVLGASDYLVKPIGREALLRAITQVQAQTSTQPILLVEDDTLTREMTARMLRTEGYRVVEAENGRIALDRIAEVRPALILLDLMMPELDGFSVVTAVREDPAHEDIPIVVVTAMELPPSQRGLLELQVETILGKAGYDRDALVEEVRRIVGERVRPDDRTGHSP